MTKITDLAGATQSQFVQQDANQETVKPKTEIQALELETKRLELQAKQLEILERQSNLQDVQERLAERELAREQKRQKSLSNGQILTQNAAAESAHQRKCNHRKGGNGITGVVGGEGADAQYAVLKHVFANGDTWIRCLRCGKTWKPQLREWHKSDAEFDRAQYEYDEALRFYTRNVTSGSAQFRFSDNGKYYRQVTANTSLR